MNKSCTGRLAGITLVMLFTVNAYALDVNIAPDLPQVKTMHKGKVVTIQRIQDQSHVLSGAYVKTSRKCPPFCIQPMKVADGVTTVAELEVLDFIQTRVNTGQGVMIDARTPSWYKKGTIPGSINIPFTTFDPGQDEVVLGATLGQLGGVRKGKQSVMEGMWSSVKSLTGTNNVTSHTWDFSDAKDILLWCNGMWCGQSPRAIKNLLALGYPAEKIRYYRGGMQAWQSLGLSVVIPD
jgi:rhodanese-related sulfurtransferase